MYEFRVREVLRVVDGDTIDTVIDLGFGLRAAFRFRVADVDTPETYGKGAVPEGRLATEFTTSWLAERAGELVVRTAKAHPSSVGLGDGAFGRWLGSFIGPGGESLADALRDAGHSA